VIEFTSTSIYMTPEQVGFNRENKVVSHDGKGQ